MKIIGAVLGKIVNSIVFCAVRAYFEKKTAIVRFFRSRSKFKMENGQKTGSVYLTFLTITVRHHKKVRKTARFELRYFGDQFVRAKK